MWRRGEFRRFKKGRRRTRHHRQRSHLRLPPVLIVPRGCSHGSFFHSRLNVSFGFPSLFLLKEDISLCRAAERRFTRDSHGLSSTTFPAGMERLILSLYALSLTNCELIY